MNVENIRRCSCVSQYLSKLYFKDLNDKYLPFEAEWEYTAARLHGAGMQATPQDLEILKKLVNKLGV